MSGAGVPMKSFTEHFVAFAWELPGSLPPRPHGERVPEGRVSGAGGPMKSFAAEAVAFFWQRLGLLPPRPPRGEGARRAAEWAGVPMKGSTEGAVAYSWRRPGFLPPRPHGERVPEGRVRGRDLVGSSKCDERFRSERTGTSEDRSPSSGVYELARSPTRPRDRESMLHVQVTLLGDLGRRLSPIVAFRSAKGCPFAERKATISNSGSWNLRSSWFEPPPSSHAPAYPHPWTLRFIATTDSIRTVPAWRNGRR